MKQEKEILSKGLERKASHPPIGNEEPKTHNNVESIRQSKHNKEALDVMQNSNTSGCRFDESGSKYQSYQTLEVGYLSEAERTGLKELITQSSSIHGGEDKVVRHVYHEQEDVENMCKTMEDLGHERQVRKVTDVHMPFDTNLICPICRKQFRIGEIQKYKKHVDKCV